MIAFDVNILVHAFREDSPEHGTVRPWLEEILASDEPFALADLVLSGFLRIVTHPRVFDPPTPLESALEFVEALRGQPHCLPLSPGERHWGIFLRLAGEARARGNLIPDAYLAALAIEAGCEWASTDLDFKRFSGLRWRSPVG